VVDPSVAVERLFSQVGDLEVESNLDKDKAEVLVVMSSIEIQKYPDSMAATAKILNATGESWTFRTDGFEATNFGLLSGNLDWQREISLRIINDRLPAPFSEILQARGDDRIAQQDGSAATAPFRRGFAPPDRGFGLWFAIALVGHQPRRLASRISHARPARTVPVWGILYC